MTTTTFRLASDAGIHAPGVVAFAINGARFKRDRDKMVNLIVKGWGVPFSAARALIKGKVPYTIEGDVVVFTHTMEKSNAVSEEGL